MIRNAALAALAVTAVASGVSSGTALTVYQTPRAADPGLSVSRFDAADTEAWALAPEPASWITIAIGLAALGAMLRVRRRPHPGVSPDVLG
jgi:hypothetical protein